MKNFWRKIKYKIILFFYSIILACILVSLFVYVGGYQLENVQQSLFSVFFIPAFVLLMNSFLNKQLNEADYLEKDLKRNQYFRENEMISEEQYNKEKERIKKLINTLPQYKE